MYSLKKVMLISSKSWIDKKDELWLKLKLVIFDNDLVIIKIKVELDLSHYATKFNLKGVAGIDTSKFARM